MSPAPRILPLKTSPSVFLFAVAVYFILVRATNRSQPITSLLASALGLLSSVREDAMAMIPVVLCLIVWSDRGDGCSFRSLGKAVLTSVAGLALALGPFALRNYLVGGEFVLTSHQGGFNLSLGNNLQNPTPYYRPVPFAAPVPHEQGIQMTIEASRRAGRTLSSGEGSAYWARAVVRTAARSPGPFLRKIAEQTLALVNQVEPGDIYGISFYRGL